MKAGARLNPSQSGWSNVDKLIGKSSSPDFGNWTALGSRSDLLMVAVGFSPRIGTGGRRVAERRLKARKANLKRRYATPTVVASYPWAEAHGYHHRLAPRGVPLPRASRRGDFPELREAPKEAADDVRRQKNIADLLRISTLLPRRLRGRGQFLTGGRHYACRPLHPSSLISDPFPCPCPT